MATSRPLMQLGIGELEEIFEKQGHNSVTLDRLKHELSHRQVPRAVALLERIQKAEAQMEALNSQRPGPKSPRTTLHLNPSSQAAKPNPIPPRVKLTAPTAISALPIAKGQPDLWAELRLPEATSRASTALSAKSVVPAPSSTAEAEPVKRPTTLAQLEPLPQLALEDACRILKVTSGDPWEKVEAARRRIVLKSSPLFLRGIPAAHAQRVLSEAKLANDAAIVIAARRSGRK